ncbi:MAG TPA: hypothetical protein VHN99_11405, partial [Deinococcales bacterium]|nr:hypothetical protein [Deinococcales bacterium]
MILAFTGNSFLAAEAAKARLRELGGGPWLDEDVTPEDVLGNAQGGLFGPATLGVDMGCAKDYKGVLAAAAAAGDANVILLDSEPDASDPDSSRKKKALEFRAQAYAKAGKLTSLPTPSRGALSGWVVNR